MRLSSKYLFLLPIVFMPFLVRADISVTEIMYDHSGSDTDFEWVEFYNSGSDTVSLSGWKFNDGSSHTLNEPPLNGGMGSLEIGPNEYVVFAGNATAFLSEYVSYSGTLIDTVMSLANTTDTVSLVDDTGATVANYTYSSESGGVGDGTSLSKIGGVWQSGSPSPGESNSESTDSGGSSEISDNTDYVTSTTEEDADFLDFVPPEDNVEILSDIVIVSGMSSEFDSLLKKSNGDISRSGNYMWNMGDGTQYVFKPAKRFEHTYYYPGEYMIVLDYYSTGSVEKDDTDRLVVKVVDASIVAKILTGGAIEISNTSKYEQDLNGWVVESDYASYKFPSSSILLAGKKVILPPRNTHFPSNISKIILRYPNGEFAYQYPLQDVDTKSTALVNHTSSSKTYLGFQSKETEDSFGLDSSENLSANTAKIPLPTNTYAYLGFAGVLVLGVGSIFYTKSISNKNSVDKKSEADEFELIEE